MVVARSDQPNIHLLLAASALAALAVVSTGLINAKRHSHRARQSDPAIDHAQERADTTSEEANSASDSLETAAECQSVHETAAERSEQAPLPEPSSPGTARDLQTALRLFGSAIIDEVDTSVGTVLKENEQMREMAREMASASAQARDQFQASMERATEAEGGIEELNSFSSELTSSIQVIGTAVRSSITIVKDVTAQAAVTRSCVDAMALLSGAVGDIVELIETIARQSRMLALNATIEAARAGDAGKGFRVVAQEVDLLARRTGAATQTISSKIDQMIAMVSDSVAALQALTVTIESIDSASTDIGRAVAEQEGLVDRVSTSLEGMRTGVFTLSREIREAAQIAANSGMLSDLVLETANSVDSLMTGLKEKLQDIGGSMAPLSAALDTSDHGAAA